MLPLLFFVLLSVSFGSEYCIRVTTGTDLEKIVEDYKKIKDIPDVRVEWEKGIYTLRVGGGKRAEDLKVMLAKVKKIFPHASVEECKKESQSIPPPTVDLSGIEKKLDGLKKSLEDMKRNEGNYSVEELALAGAGLVGALFLITWFFLLRLYRKVEISGLQNTSLLADIVKVTKVLTLLGKGYAVKIEEGKLMVFNKKEKRWEEAE